jgi:hypothetical protein
LGGNGRETALSELLLLSSSTPLQLDPSPLTIHHFVPFVRGRALAFAPIILAAIGGTTSWSLISSGSPLFSQRVIAIPAALLTPQVPIRIRGRTALRNLCPIRRRCCAPPRFPPVRSAAIPKLRPRFSMTPCASNPQPRRVVRPHSPRRLPCRFLASSTPCCTPMTMGGIRSTRHTSRRERRHGFGAATPPS